MATVKSILGVIRAGNFRYAVNRRIRLRQVATGRITPLEPAPPGQEQVVVCLTSYGARLQTVHLAIRSLMMQTVRPNKVVLYLDGSIDVDVLPDDLLVLCEYGLEIRVGYEDLGPHKKYYYAFKEFPQALVITADDDLFYTADTVATLLQGHCSYPDCVVARRVHRMCFDVAGQPLPYREWPYEWRPDDLEPHAQALATGGAGALYPAALFDESWFALEDVRGVAKWADDLYLKAIEAKHGIRVLYVPNSRNMPYVLDGTQTDALYHDNIEGGRNDAVLRALMESHGLAARDFQDDGGMLCVR